MRASGSSPASIQCVRRVPGGVRSRSDKVWSNPGNGRISGTNDVLSARGSPVVPPLPLVT